MLISLHSRPRAISSYLARPRIISARHRWNGFHTSLVIIKREHPNIIWRTAMALLLWTTGNISLHYITHQPLLPAQAAAANIAPTPDASSTATSTTVVKLASAKSTPVPATKSAAAVSTTTL